MPKNRKLTPAIEEGIVEFLIDDTFRRSKQLRHMTDRVRDAQAKLRRAASDEAWSAYLELEDAINARVSKEVRLVFRRMLAVYAFATLEINDLPAASRRS